MEITAIIIIAMIILLFLDILPAFKSGNRRFAWFYLACYTVGFTVLILNSIGIKVYGPSQLVLYVAELLGLVGG